MEQQRILKAHSLRELGHKVVFELDDFHKQCDEHLAETRDQAQQYLHHAQREAGSLIEESRREGFQAGYAAGMQRAALEIQTKADAKAKSEIQLALAHGRKAFELLAQEIASAKIEWMTRWETNAIKLCVAIAEKVIRAELASQPRLSQTMIRELLEMASSEQRVIARVHPQDAEALNHPAEETGGFPRFRQMVEFRPDPSLSRGDCVVELEQGYLDGRITAQLERLTAELVPLEEPANGHA
jgi:flagellar assembly protein FliH